MKLVSSLALLAGIAQASVPYTNCGSASDLLQDVVVNATPYPPTPGKAVEIDITGTLSTAVKSGEYTLSVSYDGITIITKTGDVCSLGMSCPQAAGPVKVSKSESLPSSIPAGTYDAKISATANGGTPLFCADLKLAIGGAEAAEEDVVTTGKTAPFKVLHSLIEKAGGAQKGFKAGFEIEAGAEIEARLGLGGGIGLDAADGDAVQKAGAGSFNGAETLKNLGLMVGGGADLEI
jgi:hypothetical protein